MDTIFAVSSGRPPAAIAVIRISGLDAFDAGAQLAGKLPLPRRASLKALRDGEGRLLDRALVLVFPAPTTATGEDIVELHCHGGRAVIAAVESTLATMSGLRAAEPGEFTRRALLNGRIDLTEAEGLADLLEAETEGQRIAALRGAEGQISRLVRGWMDRTAALSAQIEALLDFSDEDDVASGNSDLAAIAQAAHTLSRDIGIVVDSPPVERLRDGIRVVIAGPPNGGKSTLLNRLADRDAAIVSSISGTTRDRIEVPVTRDGIAYVLTDTAGLTDETIDTIEQVGVARAERAVIEADILLWLADTPPPREDAIWLHGRSDLPGRGSLPVGPALAITQDLPSSIAAVWSAIDVHARSLLPRSDDLAVNRRQRDLCAKAAFALAVGTNDALVLAEHLRIARSALAELLGLDTTGAMLDALFFRFCIGK